MCVNNHNVAYNVIHINCTYTWHIWYNTCICCPVEVIFSVAMLDRGKMFARSPAELGKNINLKELCLRTAR